MQLDVPLIRQPPDTVDCGIAGLTMLLNYHSISIKFEDIKQEIAVDKTGTYAPQLGMFLLKKGFKVSIITLHPSLFTNKDKQISKTETIKRFSALAETTKSEQNKKILKLFSDFLHAGGNIITKRPSLKDIHEQITQKNPIGALLTTNFITETKPCFNFHLNIITGLDQNYIYVNDPMHDERGGKKKYLIGDFFYGLYASAYGDLDNACLILVSKN